MVHGYLIEGRKEIMVYGYLIERRSFNDEKV